MMECVIIDIFVGYDVVELGSYVQMFFYFCYMCDDFLFVIEYMMLLCMVIFWVYFVVMIIQYIVVEKEYWFKEVMKIMGLNNVVYWVVWFIIGFVQLFIFVIVFIVILKYGQVFMYSYVVIIWFFLVVYVVVIIMFCFLVFVLYFKVKLVFVCGGIIYFLSYVFYMYVVI